MVKRYVSKSSTSSTNDLREAGVGRFGRSTPAPNLAVFWATALDLSTVSRQALPHPHPAGCTNICSPPHWQKLHHLRNIFLCRRRLKRLQSIGRPIGSLPSGVRKGNVSLSCSAWRLGGESVEVGESLNNGE